MLEKLLEFENSSKVLEYRYQYGNTLMWPFIRNFIFWDICYMAANLQVGEERQPVPMLSSYETVMRNVAGNPYLSTQKDIMFLYHGYGVNIQMENGKWYNRLFDCYAEKYPYSTYMLEDASKLPYQNRCPRSVKYTDYINNRIQQKALNGQACDADQKTCDEFVRYLEENIPFHLDYQFCKRIRQAVLNIAVLLPYYDSMYRKLFQNIRPKIVFIQSGCYGGIRSYVLKILNSLGIKSFEIQHGVIGQEICPYNYSDLLYYSEEFRQYLPYGIALWGKYWVGQIHAPVKKYVLGNPHFTNEIKSYDFIHEERSKRLLIIVSNIHKHYTRLLDELLPALSDDYCIELRLHPAFKGERRWYHKYERFSNFQIESEGTVYEALARCEFVTGDASTALWEAAAVGKKVLVYHSDYSDFYHFERLGPVYENAKQLIELMQNNQYKEFPDPIFSTDWENNYRRLLKWVIRDREGEKA